MVKFACAALPRDPAFKWRKIVAWVTSPQPPEKIVTRVKATALRKLKLVKPFTITFAAGTQSRAATIMRERGANQFFRL